MTDLAGWLVVWVGFNGLLRLFQSVSDRLPKRGRNEKYVEGERK